MDIIAMLIGYTLSAFMFMVTVGAFIAVIVVALILGFRELFGKPRSK